MRCEICVSSYEFAMLNRLGNSEVSPVGMITRRGCKWTAKWNMSSDVQLRQVK